MAKQIDFAAGTSDKMRPEQRGLLARTVQRVAAAEPAGDRREFLDAFAEDFGLIDDAE